MGNEATEILPASTEAPLQASQVRPWLVALGGFALLYLPIYWWAAQTIWKEDDHAHGMIILAVVAWLFWQQREAIVRAAAPKGALWGGLCFGLGLLAYVVGRVLGFSVMEFASQPLVALGLVLCLGGAASVRVAWFPLIYLVFMIPLPSMLVDAVTGALKQWVSVIAEVLLYHADYPIGRSGVTLTIGNYQLLVADACSGLHSMFSLAALGLLFMYLMARKSVAHNMVMIVAIAPIAFVANIVRVMVLVLVTYHLGDEAGQGFLHGAAGMVLMLAALVIFFALDVLLLKLFKPAPPAPRVEKGGDTPADNVPAASAN